MPSVDQILIETGPDSHAVHSLPVRLTLRHVRLVCFLHHRSRHQSPRMPPPTKRRGSKIETPPESTSLVKKAKITHEGTPESAAQTPSGSPSRRRSGGATSNVLWIRNPRSDLPTVKQIPWMDKRVYGFFSQVQVRPYCRTFRRV
jgi:hypothetical protein